MGYRSLPPVTVLASAKDGEAEEVTQPDTRIQVTAELYSCIAPECVAMPVITCPGRLKRLTLPDVPSSPLITCSGCKTQITMPFAQPAGTVPPDLPTPASLRTLRIPEAPPPNSAGPPSQVEGPRGTSDSYGGFSNRVVIAVLIALIAIASAVLVLMK
jgi:hypothetical protein